MKKEISKELLDKYIKEDIDPVIRRVIIDVINLLSKKGYNVLKYIKKINDTEFLLYDANEMNGKPYINVYNGKEEKIEMDWKNFEGFHIPFIELNKDGKPFLYKNLCAYNDSGAIKKSEKCFKQKVIHELLHLLSASNDVTIEDGNYAFYSGLNKYEIEITEDKKIKYTAKEGVTEFNEAATELIANNMYKELYDKHFFIASIEKEGMYYPFINVYYLNTNLLRIFNLFTIEITSQKKLLYSYLNNKPKYYLEILESQLGLKDDDLYNITFVFQNIVFEYFRDHQKGRELFAKAIMPIFDTIVYNFNINMKNSMMEEKMKKVYISYIKVMIEFMCNFPLFRDVKNEFMTILETIKM